MLMPKRALSPLCFVVFAGALLTAQTMRAETLASTNADNRLVLAFDVADAALAEFMPEGWSATPFGGGPFAGADLLLVFVDSHRIVDPEGKPMHGGRYRGLAVAAPAKAEGSGAAGAMVTHIYISDPEINPYKNSVGAEISRQVVSTGSGNEAASTRQSWSVAPETGGEVALSLAWSAGMPGISEGESKVYSAVDPDSFRIYRYEQYVDLVKSAPAEVDRVGSLALDVSIPELAPLFDGSETLVGILDVPWYMREIWLP